MPPTSSAKSTRASTSASASAIRSASRVEPPRQLAGELSERERVRGLGLGVDQVGHRFGLCQIDAAVEERAQRELAGRGEPRAGREQRGRAPAGPRARPPWHESSTTSSRV